MALIEGFRVRNYRALRDVTLGRLWTQQVVEPLTPFTVVIGKNGAGKSTLFDAFGFVADCLNGDVETACDAKQRGGFDRMRSKAASGPIQFEIYYRENQGERPITYELSINLDASGRPIVESEVLRQRRKSQTQAPSGTSYFVDALAPREVWILKNGKDGFSAVQRASDIEVVRHLVEEGLPLGGLWYSDYLDDLLEHLLPKIIGPERRPAHLAGHLLQRGPTMGAGRWTVDGC